MAPGLKSLQFNGRGPQEKQYHLLGGQSNVTDREYLVLSVVRMKGKNDTSPWRHQESLAFDLCLEKAYY